MAGPLKPTSARERRKKSTFLYRINDQLTVRMRSLDMVTMVMENLIPFHLLKAAEKFEKIEKGIAGVESSDLAVRSKFLDSLNEEDVRQTMEFIRNYVCVVVIEPKVVMIDDGNEDHLPITDLTGEELISIFYARSPQEEAPLTKQQAEDFRGKQPGVSSETPRDGDTVRSPSLLVDLSEREVIHA